MEKIWITGAKGHVGTALSALLDCREYEIFPTDVDEVDVTDLEAVNNYARVNRPDIIINCVVTVMLQAAKLILTKHLQ